MITIKDTLGNVRFSTEINTGSRRKFSLMSEDYIVLKFSVEDPVYFKLGDYTDTELGLFELVDLYKPTLNDSTGAYDYELRLDAHYYKWKNKIFKFNPEVGGSEAGWKLTATLDVHLGVFLRNLSALGYTYKGTPFEVNIDSTVAKTSKLIVYDNTNLIDALTQMAETWECEWWVEDNQIRFGRCEFGDPVDFVINENVERMPREESKATFATRVYAFGSTRNIPNDYRPVDESVVVNGIVQKRLMMPTGVPYVDAYPDMTTEEAVEDVVIFDYIYPRRTGTMSSVTPVERPENVENEDGSTTQQKYIVYQFKDTGITFSKDYILPGEELRIVFQTGAMAGMDFAVTFNPDNLPEKLEDGSWNPQAQLWEIVRNEDYGRMLPADTLIPSNGDTYNLYGFDSTSPVFEDMIKRAEEELEEKARDYVEKTKIDPNTYPCTMMSDYMYNDGNVRTNEFTVGARINLINPAYFENGRVSRVIGFEFDLDIPYFSPTFTIGETASYSRIGEIEDKVDELTYKGQVFTGTGSGVYVIGTNDNTPPTNKNVYSALKVLREFVRYQGWVDQPVRTFDPVKFNSVTSNDFESKLKGWVIDALGNAEFRDVLLRSFKSWNFAAGPLGAGVGMVNDDELQTDKLLVRKIMYVLEMMIQRMRFQGGIMVLSPATGFKIDRVETFDTYYRVYCRPEDFNEFEVNDQARIQNFNGNNIKYLWSLVLSKGDDYIDISRVDKDGDGVPAEGDEIVQLGNRTNPDRQDAVLLSAVNGEVGIFTYYGINSFDLSSKEGSWLGKHGGKKGAVIRGEVHITAGSSGLEQFDEYEDVDKRIQDAKDLADDAQTSANTAQSAANAAQSTANQAQADANAANSKLTTWASDNYISPQEKTALRQQKSDIQSEQKDIEANANRYVISLASYMATYNAAIAALNKYTATSPENIAVESDYNNISAYYTARQTILNSIAAAAKAQADKATGAIGMDGGKMLYADPEFKKGLNGVAKYTNSSNVSPDYIASKLTVERVTKPSDAPTQSGYCLKVTCKAAQAPGYGGVYQYITSRANAVFVQKIIAKIPVGYKINTASNSMGAGYSDTWLTPTEGTGKYTTYLRKVVCGATGTFSTGGYVYITGNPAPTESAPLEWYIAYMTAFDLTADGYGDIEYNAKDDLAQQLGYSNFDKMVENAAKGETIIKGAYINTKLIDVETLVADTALVDKLIGRELNFTLGSVGGFKMESTLLYSGAKFGTGGAGIAMQSMTNNYGFNVYKDNNNYMEMFQRSSEWGLKGVVGGKTILQLGSTNKIGGFDITDDRIGSIFGTGGVGNGMSLYNFVVKFKSDNSEDSRFAALGTSVYPSSTAQSTLLRLEETRSGNLDNILSYFYCSGASGVLDSRNIAIKVGKGDVDIDNGNLNMAAGNFMKMKGQIHFDNVVAYTGSGAVTITADSGHFIYLTPITGNPVVSVSSGLPIGSWFIIAHTTTAGGYYYIKLSGSDRFRRRGNAYQQVNSHNQDPSLIFKVSDTTWIIGNLPVNWIDWN